MSVDPLAHLYPAHSPYAYVLNNPVNMTDPDGRSAICETCPEGDEFDRYHNSDEHFTYDKKTDLVYTDKKQETNLEPIDVVDSLQQTTQHQNKPSQYWDII